MEYRRVAWSVGLAAALAIAAFWLIGNGTHDVAPSVPEVANAEAPGERAESRLAHVDDGSSAAGERTPVAASSMAARAQAPSGVEIEIEAEIVRGRVFHPAGWPVPEAIVAVLDLAPDRAQPGVTVTGKTDAAGRFELQTGLRGTGRRFVAARHAGTRPATVELTGQQAEDELELRLGEGATLAGHVYRSGRPCEGARVQVDLRYGVPGLFGFGRECFWLRDAVEEKTATARVDAQGHFAIHGLATDEFDVAFHVPGATTGPVRRKLRTPKLDVWIDVSPAWLEITATVGGAPVQEARVAIGKPGSWQESEGALPRRIAVSPETEVQVRVEAEGAIPATVTCRAPRAGGSVDVPVELVPASRGTLFVEATGASAHGITALELRIVEFDRRMTGTRVDGDRFSFGPLTLEPRTYQFLIQPTGENARFALPVRTVVAVPAEGDLEISAPVALGGRLEWSVADRPDGDSWVICELSTADGQRGLRNSFGVRFTSPSGLVIETLPLDEAIPAGDYQVRARCGGCIDDVRRITITAGAVTDVAFVLRPADR